MAVTPLPIPPSRADAENFAERADDFLGALPTFATELNVLQVDVNTKQTLAASSETNAAASALASANTADVAIWVSGTTYAIGVNRFSPINFLTYRRKTAGAGTTDPSLDSTNWALLTGLGDATLSGTQTFTGAKTFTVAPIGVTAANGTNDATLATTAFVTTADNLKAPLASPSFTGVPLSTTAAVGTNTTQIATTAFVNSEISADVGVSNSALVKTALNASGSAPIYACRAWVIFNGTGTVSVLSGGNVSSITDNGVGDYTVNFSVAMPDALYCLSGAAATSNNTRSTVIDEPLGGIRTSSSIQVRTGWSGADTVVGTRVDSPFVSVVITH